MTDSTDPIADINCIHCGPSRVPVDSDRAFCPRCGAESCILEDAPVETDDSEPAPGPNAEQEIQDAESEMEMGRRLVGFSRIGRARVRNHIRFNKHCVSHGHGDRLVKARVFYAMDGHVSGQPCVTIYARDFSRKLKVLFPEEYVNTTNAQEDHHDEGCVRLFEGHWWYHAARKRAGMNLTQQRIQNAEQTQRSRELQEAAQTQREA